MRDAIRDVILLLFAGVMVPFSPGGRPLAIKSSG